jgi:glucokinase
MNPHSPTKALSSEGGIASSRRSLIPAQHVIGIDLGGTKIAAGLAAFPEGCVLARRLTPTLAPRGGSAVLDEVVRLARELTEEGKAPGLSADLIGLGVCELVDRNGKVASANCIQWLDLPVRERLAAIAPATIEAAARAAALAEALFGAGRSLRNFLYITVGTGISCCLMLDGKPHLGARRARDDGQQSVTGALRAMR